MLLHHLRLPTFYVALYPILLPGLMIGMYHCMCSESAQELCPWNDSIWDLRLRGIRVACQRQSRSASQRGSTLHHNRALQTTMGIRTIHRGPLDSGVGSRWCWPLCRHCPFGCIGPVGNPHWQVTSTLEYPSTESAATLVRVRGTIWNVRRRKATFGIQLIRLCPSTCNSSSSAGGGVFILPSIAGLDETR